MTETATPFVAEPASSPTEKRPPANSWVVSAYKFRLHGSLNAAEEERDRLARKLPYKQFRIYRVKGSLHASNAAQRLTLLETALREIASDAWPTSLEDSEGAAQNHQIIVEMQRIAAAALARMAG